MVRTSASHTKAVEAAIKTALFSARAWPCASSGNCKEGHPQKLCLCGSPSKPADRPHDVVPQTRLAGRELQACCCASMLLCKHAV